MATTTREKKTAGNPKIEAAKEVPFSETTPPTPEETPDLTDADKEAANEYNEKEAQRQKDLDSVPETEDEYVQQTLERVIAKLHEVEDHKETMLVNTASEDGIKQVAHASNNTDIVAARNEYNSVDAKVEELEEQLKALRADREEKWNSLYEKAEEVLKENIDENVRIGAKFNMDKVNKNIDSMLDMVRMEVNVKDPQSDEEKEVSAFITMVNGRRYAGVRVVSTTGDRPPTSRERSQAIRDWAKANNTPAKLGIVLNERGRIPQPIVDEYDKANS